MSETDPIAISDGEGGSTPRSPWLRCAPLAVVSLLLLILGFTAPTAPVALYVPRAAAHSRQGAHVTGRIPAEPAASGILQASPRSQTAVRRGQRGPARRSVHGLRRADRVRGTAYPTLWGALQWPFAVLAGSVVWGLYGLRRVWRQESQPWPRVCAIAGTRDGQAAAGEPPARPSIALPRPADATAAFRAFRHACAAGGPAARAVLRFGPAPQGPAPPLAGLTAITLQELAQRHAPPADAGPGAGPSGAGAGRVLFATTVEGPAACACGHPGAGVHALVEDEAGDRVPLCLVHCVADGASPAEALPEGTRLALLEPCLCAVEPDEAAEAPRPPTGPGGVRLHCDNPQRAVVFQSERQWGLARAGEPCDPELPERSDVPRLLEEVQGKIAAGDFGAAARACGRALRGLPGDSEALRLRVQEYRAVCHRQTWRWGLALQDYEAIRQSMGQFQASDPDSVRVHMGYACSLAMQQRLPEARDTLAQLRFECPVDADICRLWSQVCRALEEQEGRFDLMVMEAEAPVSAQRLPEVHGEFVAADVDLGAAVPGKGRGVLTREAVPRHHLVLASRAFATAVDPPDPEGLGAVDAATGAAVGASECLLIDAVIRELVADPSRAPELYALDAGPEYQHRPSPDGATAVDVGRVRGIVRTNALRLPSRKGVWRGRAAEPRGSGLWLRAALFNHSCTPNCMWLQVRDYLLVYTTRPVSAGEELCLGYGPETFAAARRYFRHRGTECQCPRCALLRVRPDLQEIEAEVAAAVRHWRTHRAPPELSPERRAAIRAALEPLPVAQQRPLDWVLQMEGAALASEGRYDGAAAAYARAARILYAAQGASLAWARLQCTAVRYLMVWGRTAPAVQILRDIYRSCYVPFGWPAAEFKAVVYRMVAAPPECELRLRRLIHFAIDEPGMG